jgi:hypothetical protein
LLNPSLIPFEVSPKNGLFNHRTSLIWGHPKWDEPPGHSRLGPMPGNSSCGSPVRKCIAGGGRRGGIDAGPGQPTGWIMGMMMFRK